MEQSDHLDNYDLLILRDLAGEKVDGLVWGAAMSMSIGWLFRRGYVTRRRDADAIVYEISEKGRAAIAR